jgi:hypothetical protein
VTSLPAETKATSRRRRIIDRRTSPHGKQEDRDDDDDDDEWCWCCGKNQRRSTTRLKHGRPRRRHAAILIVLVIGAVLVLVLLQGTMFVVFHHRDGRDLSHSLRTWWSKSAWLPPVRVVQHIEGDKESSIRPNENQHPFHLSRHRQWRPLATQVETTTEIVHTPLLNLATTTLKDTLHDFKVASAEEDVLTDPLDENYQSGKTRKQLFSLVPPPFILNQPRRVEYLGILIDAGRHYFDTAWLYRLVDFLPMVGFNMIHFRLTDDQAFAIQLECCQTQLERALHFNIHDSQRFYTPDQLRQLVAYAKTKGIVIIPEVNVPVHAGGFGPDWIVPCPNFICRTGYGIPLNVSHQPHLSQLLVSMLREILDIFDHPPFLHLGGDEVSMSVPCLREAGILPIETQGTTTTNGHDERNSTTKQEFGSGHTSRTEGYFDHFEQVVLRDVLREVNYPESQVLRWEMGHGNKKTKDRQHENLKDNNNIDVETRDKKSSAMIRNTKNRTGGMIHYWEGAAKQPISSKPTLHQNSSNTNYGHRSDSSKSHHRRRHSPYFSSRGLYFDTNKFDWAWDIYQNTLQLLDLNLHDQLPTGVVVGTFELNASFWHHRSVLPRLVAVALGVFAASSSSSTTAKSFPPLYGASNDNLLARQFYRKYYRPACLQVGLNRATCWQNGRILRDTHYEERWKATWVKWKSNVCSRLTEVQPIK